jgi:hypothetical protein
MFSDLKPTQTVRPSLPILVLSAETLANLPRYVAPFAVKNAFTPEQAAAREAERREIAARHKR